MAKQIAASSDNAAGFFYLGRQLEWSLLKFHTFTGRIREEESEINMHEMSVDIDQDISIVSVFDL